MAGLSSATTAYHDILWADAELLGVSVDYENLLLTLRESTGRVRRIICEGCIGYEAMGLWDEIVITEAHLSAAGPFLTRCVEELEQRLGANFPPSGSEARNRSEAMELTVVLSDGCKVRVAMKGLSLDAVVRI